MAGTGFFAGLAEGFANGAAIAKSWSESRSKKGAYESVQELQELQGRVQQDPSLLNDAEFAKEWGTATGKGHQAMLSGGVKGKDFEKVFPSLDEYASTMYREALRTVNSSPPGSPEALEAWHAVAVVQTHDNNVESGYHAETGNYYWVPISDDKNPDAAKQEAVVVSPELLLQLGTIADDPKKGTQSVLSNSRMAKESNARIAQQEKQEYGQQKRFEQTEERLTAQDARSNARADAAEGRAQTDFQWDQVKRQREANQQGGTPKDVSEALAEPSAAGRLMKRYPELEDFTDEEALPRLVAQQARALNAAGQPASIDDTIEVLIQNKGQVQALPLSAPAAAPAAPAGGALPLKTAAGFGDQTDVGGPTIQERTQTTAPGMGAAPGGTPPAPAQAAPRGAPAPGATSAGATPAPGAGQAAPGAQANLTPELRLLMGDVQQGKLPPDTFKLKLQQQMTEMQKTRPNVTPQEAITAMARTYARAQQRAAQPGPGAP